uniref:Uncharacterized protein n=1 Tax=Oryza brachyantha TaxID=4533 RepID=J3MNY0_ORYBR
MPPPGTFSLHSPAPLLLRLAWRRAGRPRRDPGPKTVPFSPRLHSHAKTPSDLEKSDHSTQNGAPNSTGDMGRGGGVDVVDSVVARWWRENMLDKSPLRCGRAVLGRVKDFLGEMAKANDKLRLDVKNKRPEEYDIEALTGNEKEYIEMDLLLGVADMHSEKAVEVDEATMNGFPPAGRSFTCSSSDSEDDSDNRDDDGGDEQNMAKDEDEAETQTSKGKKPNKRQKIIVLN